ncbi:MAG: insulinase family protein [Candidatus Campbellbacteria bacterium]|nr:insulinase family protein [Candidatus Campbellbacteria bacterium]
MQNITTKRLKNGMKLIHERRAGSTISAVSIRLKAGAVYGEKPGVAHFLEHLVLDGTKNYPTKNELENLVSECGGRGGGKTWYEDVWYWALVPSHTLDSALKYVFEATFQPLLREEDFIREQKVVFQEAKRHESQSSSLSYDKAQSLLFSGTPFARRVLGTPEEVMNVQHKDAIDFWTKRYLPHNAVLSVVADMDFESIVKLVEEIFFWDEEKNTSISPTLFQFSDIRSPSLSFIDDSQADQNRVLISYRAPTFFDETKPAVDMLATILGGGKTSRLFKAVRHEKGLSYDTSASVSSDSECGKFGISSGTTPELLPELFDIVCREVLRMCTEECTDGELEPARERSIFNYYVKNERAQERTESLSWFALHAEHPEEFLDIESRYAKVTKKDIQDAAKTIFASFPAVVVVKRTTDTISIDPDNLVYRG